MEKPNFKEICKMYIQQLTNFPYIEKDFDALTDYQLLCKIVDYLNKVIENQNTQNETITQLYNAFVKLKEYIDNLDLQDEVNNKLDEMASDGTLLDLLSNYANLIRIYNTTENMLQDNTLENNQKVQTLGYYSINDGGGGLYVIKNEEPLNGYYENTLNNKYALLIINNDTIDFTQLGAKANDNTFDNKPYFDKYISLCNKDNKTYKLKINNGEWYTSPIHVCRIGGVNIEGISSFSGRGYFGTQIKAINTQDYIFKFGGTPDMNNTTLAYDKTNTSNVIKNLTFSSDFELNYGALVLEYADYGIYDDLYFSDLIGTGLYIRSSWENYFNRLNFRRIADFTKPCIKFATIRPITGVSANISSSSFDYLMFEKISGNAIEFENNCNFINNQIGEINVEMSYRLQENEESFNIDDTTDLPNMNPMYLIKGTFMATTINTINYTGEESRTKYYRANDGRYYYYDALLAPNDLSSNSQGNIYSVIINNIYLRRNSTIIHSKNIYIAGFNLSIGLISANVVITEPFIIENGLSSLKIGEFTDRSFKQYATIPNALFLYKHCNPGAIYYDNTATNPLGLIMKKTPSGDICLNRIFYPYGDSENHTCILKVKNIAEENQSFIFRGTKNGSNSNQTISVSPNNHEWQNITITMNYDQFSPIIFLVKNTNLEFESIIFN